MTRPPRTSKRWLRLRAAVGECSADVNPDEHADRVYAVVRSARSLAVQKAKRRRWQ